MFSTKEFRDKTAGLPDLLIHAALVDSGIVLGKDGSLLAGFFFRGDDMQSASDSERNYLTALVNQYLSRFGNGWALWVDAVRMPSPGYSDPAKSHFRSAIPALIDQERRANFKDSAKHFECEYALVFQYLPPTQKQSKFTDAMFDDDLKDETKLDEKHIAEFKRSISDFEDGLGDFLNMRRMGALKIKSDQKVYLSDELVNYLHYTLTGEHIALRVPPIPMYLDSWLGYPEIWPGDTPKIGKKFNVVVTIDGFPHDGHPGILDMLSVLPLSYRWSTRFIYLDDQTANSKLNSFRKKWRQKIIGFKDQMFKTNKGTVNTDALEMAEQAEQAINDLASGAISYGYYTSVVIVSHEDRLFAEEQGRYIKREIERKGFSARVETVNAMEAWLGSIPGQTMQNVRRPLVHTLNLSDLLPLAAVWPGLNSNPCDFFPPNSPPLLQAETEGATPFRLNLHVSDVGHTLIFGPTGAGKSTLLATINAQFLRYQSNPLPDGSVLPASVTAFDKGNSLYALAKASDGAHYDLGGDSGSTPALTPLADIDSLSEALWAEEWIATCYELQTNSSFSPEQKAEVHRAILLLREAPRAERSLTDFLNTVQNQDIRDALNHYTITGGMGHLLDGAENTLNISPFTVFEMDELMKLGDKNAIPVLLYLFRRFERSLRGQPSLLSLDEAWVMLGHPVFREKLREWLKELRKKNVTVVLATQSLSDAVNSGLLDVLLEQCPTKILLPNVEAEQAGSDKTPGPADLYKMFGLNDRELQILKNGQYKRDYYYKSPYGRRMFQLGLKPLTLAFVAVSSKEDLAMVRHLEGIHGQDWPFYWLDHKGVNYEQYTQATKAA